MDELVRRAAMEGRLRMVAVVRAQGGNLWYDQRGHVVCDPKAPCVRTPATLVAPLPGMLRRAMREEWKLAD